MLKKIICISGLLALSTIGFNTYAKETKVTSDEDAYYSFNVKSEFNKSSAKAVQQIGSIITSASRIILNGANGTEDLKCHLEKKELFSTSTLDINNTLPGRADSFVIYPIEVKDNVMKMVVSLEFSTTSDGEVVKVSDKCDIQDNMTTSYKTQKVIYVELGKSHRINLNKDVSFDIGVEKYDRNKF